MTKKNSTLIIIVLDRSGSMGSLVDDVIGGCDTFVQTQAKAPGECKISLTQFDTEFDSPWTLRDIRDVPSIKTFYEPRGGTALNDAIAETINKTGIELSKRPEHERPEHVIFLIVTDGEENSSKEFKGPAGKAAIKKMIEHQTKVYNWKFTYIGANVDAFAEADGYGIAPSAAINFMGTKKGVAGSYQVMSSAVLRSRVAGESLSYNAQERAIAMGGESDGDDDPDADLGHFPGSLPGTFGVDTSTFQVPPADKSVKRSSKP